MYALNVKSNLVGIGLKTSVPTQGGGEETQAARVAETDATMRLLYTDSFLIF